MMFSIVSNDEERAEWCGEFIHTGGYFYASECVLFSGVVCGIDDGVYGSVGRDADDV